MHSDANNILANDITLMERETLQRNSESFDLKYQSLKIRSQTLHACLLIAEVLEAIPKLSLFQ